MIALPVYECFHVCLVAIGFILAVILVRVGTTKGWYLKLGKDKNGIFEIPQEAIDFNKHFANEEYTIDFVKRGIVAMIWFFFTFLITIMATVGGNAITENNPYFKIPCIILLLIMRFVCIWKIIMVMVQIVEDWVLCTAGIFIIARTIEKEPLCIKMSRSKSAINKDLRNIIKEQNKKEASANV